MKRYRLRDGKDLFTYTFYARMPLECNSFLAEVTADLHGKTPTRTHRGLSALEASGRLVRHYTMNIDDLAAQAGMSMWQPSQPEGRTVALHGTALQTVCKQCGDKATTSEAVRNAMRRKEEPKCTREGCRGELRWRIMMYDDKEADLVTDPGVMAMMGADVAEADVVLWLGISFEQSASTAYFRHVRAALDRCGKGHTVPVVIVNPSEDATFNIITAVSNMEQMRLWKVLQPSDVLFPVSAPVGAPKEEAVAEGSGGTNSACPGGSPKRMKHESGLEPVNPPLDT